ncbi:hypothetical protein [Shewanella donghaensis]|uniref:hypothetical protein n=1 Tax=Shewanella donghaensis TaxID=238836 RepID=UPI001182F6A7|nr:hypothetical protein [Shewanella donghaensis]
MEINRLKVALSMALVLPLTASASEDLPQILSYIPNCPPTIIKKVDNNDVIEANQIFSEKEIETLSAQVIQNKALSRGLLRLTENAKTLNADAVIINNLHTSHIDRYVRVYDEVVRPFVREVNQVHIRTSVDYIKLCDNDKTLSSNRTPYNNKGAQIVQSDVVISVDMQTNENILIEADNYEIPSPIITPSSAYGISIQDSESSLDSLGPASAQLLLSDGSKAFAYGRNLWFFVKKGKIDKITHNVNMLNSHGKNMIVYSENFDSNSWVIQEDIRYRENLTRVSLIFPEKEKHGDYYKVNNESNLYLKFETYNSSYQEEPEDLLNGFVVTSDNNLKPNTNIAFSQLDKFDLKSMFNPNKSSQYSVVNDQIFNKILLNDDGEWAIASNNLLFNIEGNNITKIRLTESLLEEQSEQQFLAILNKYNIPTNKADFIKRYPNIEDNFETLVLNSSDYSMEANFASYDDDAQLIELTIDY